ncbi:MAG TPA: hypothetical protein DCL81_15110 [Algoriphagus sp.]|jgi:hypothetical protein|uniref:hypothetical protein n=1 Tax=Algoriphagus sp. TaxID=1872435 RepID=UPI000C69A4ED|nr:hypothetical protein [Algoriphagus sp.]MAL13360.1 hypothetical protein [Algoriphagus sp.]MAN85572.1 hypothetical protein [Algoriphagus sp.]HAD51731.1 hypothetical protein [Algoriphagus sp.]HAH37782.1 hypothetical protein [Algoriphagus sp.]HAS58494.1 hypothetical protein [Algoriphagus sp.]|tara:strand:- start:437 stop:769 length:333 start_codon:yes stop_codon:yes gene_type:complete
MNEPNYISKYQGMGISFFVVFVILSIMLLFTACVSKKDMNIPDKPTIWTVSEVDALEYKYGKGFVFYKVIPINPGGLNARFVWIMDKPGAFQVGDIVKFEVINHAAGPVE